MNILLLGHKGMLGRDLFNRLIVSHDVTGKDIVDVDITSGEACRDIVAEVRPDVVINAAAYTDVDNCESEGEKCSLVNAEGVKNIALACREKAIKIVHFSTDYVFDGEKGTSYVEYDTCHPLNHYGESKLMGEEYLQELSKDFLIIRSAWLYGRHGRNFVKTIVNKARTEKHLKVVDDQIGSPTFTWDLAGAVQLLIEDGYAGIFHVTNRGSCSWYEFAAKIIKHAGMTDVSIEAIKSNEVMRPARRPRCSVLSCRKFMDTTGKTMRYWQVALDDFIGKTGGY
jgi:dTDP-4-dehydrorhamnose reductase